MKKIIWILISITLVLGAFVFTFKYRAQTSNEILFLYPEGADIQVLQGWKNIAEEEGLHLFFQSNNEFTYSKKLSLATKYKGIIIADGIHARMTPTLAQHLKMYVREGGALFLMYDAATQEMNGQPRKKGALFSDGLAFKYAVAPTPDKVITSSGPVGQHKDILDSLGIPPGKCVTKNALEASPTEQSRKSIGAITTINQSRKNASRTIPKMLSEENNKTQTSADDELCAISSYGYGALTYPYFLTPAMPPNTSNLLLTTPDHEFIAGVKKLDRGKILFVNLPLTYLWQMTDAMLAHAFLRYFGVNMLHLPILSPVPNGVGGLIMDLHVESKDALDAFPILEKWGIFRQGPYSIDFTAGPGLDTLNDNKGLDVLHNHKTQEWIHYLAKLKNAIGSDGGWAHNYYGLNANENNKNEFLKYIIMNNEAMEKVLGKKVLEYVPSVGNQPTWATRYLEQAGFLAYYTTSNTGSAPTQNFREGLFDQPSLWSFPIVPFGLHASLRDTGFADLPAELVMQWLIDTSKFVARHHESRLIYYHPTDILFYPQYLYSLRGWLQTTQALANQGLFHWYSMVDIANFLNARRLVDWNVKQRNGWQLFNAIHPQSLAHQAWLIIKSACDKPVINSGAATINEDELYWIVIAGNGKRLTFQCRTLSGESPAAPAGATDKIPSALISVPVIGNNSGLITLWFDNDSVDELNRVLPIMENYGYKGAISVTVNNLGKPGYMTWGQLVKLQNKGWETTSHGLSNTCDFTYYTTANTVAELRQSQKILQQHGLSSNQFVMPCGYSGEQIANYFIDKHPPIIETAQQYYSSFRTFAAKRNNPLPLLDPYNLKGFLVTKGTTEKAIQDKINNARNEKYWLILVFQEILSDEQLVNIFELIKKAHLPVVLPMQVIGK